MTIDRSMMIPDDGGSFGDFTLDIPETPTLTRREALDEVNLIRKELRDKGRTPKQIQNNPRLKAAQEVLDRAIATENANRNTTTLKPLPEIKPTEFTGPTEDERLAELQRLEDLRLAEQKKERIITATESLRVFLKNLFFDSEDAFIEDVLKAAKGDFEIGLDPEVILKKMEDYENPNSLFAKRFAGNVELRKQGIEPLSPEVYLQQERVYREYLDAVGLGDLAQRNTYASLIGKRIAPTELARRIENVFDVWDSADTAYKNELERTLGITGVGARNEVAKVLLLGKDAAAELQKKVATAGVATEARARGLDVGSAEQLGALGVTREQARAGYEQIALTAPRLGTLSEIYDKKTVDALQTQQELEREQFQGMQSQRRRRLAEQETAAFMGQSGTAGAQSLGRRRTGSI